MRMLMNVQIPNREFNKACTEGTIGRKINQILEDTGPEAVYFTEQNGKRGAVMIVDVPDPSRIPALAEPWFLTFDAEVAFHVVMSPDDLQKSGLEKIGKKWH